MSCGDEILKEIKKKTKNNLTDKFLNKFLQVFFFSFCYVFHIQPLFIYFLFSGAWVEIFRADLQKNCMQEKRKKSGCRRMPKFLILNHSCPSLPFHKLGPPLLASEPVTRTDSGNTWEPRAYIKYPVMSRLPQYPYEYSTYLSY